MRAGVATMGLGAARRLTSAGVEHAGCGVDDERTRRGVDVERAGRGVDGERRGGGETLLTPPLRSQPALCAPL